MAAEVGLVVEPEEGSWLVAEQEAAEEDSWLVAELVAAVVGIRLAVLEEVPEEDIQLEAAEVGIRQEAVLVVVPLVAE